MAAEVVGGHAEADRVADGRGPRLELPGDVVELGAAEVDLADHLAAGEERRHRLEQLARGPTARPNPSGPSILWPLNA